MFFTVSAASFMVCAAVFALSSLITPKIVKSYGSLKPEKQLMFHSYVVSLYPALIVPPGALLAIMRTSSKPSDVLTANCNASRFFTALSVGYMFYDFVFMNVFRTKTMKVNGVAQWWLYFVHHLLSFVLWPYAVLNNRTAFFINFFIISEASSIPLCIRWFLIQCKMADTQFFAINNMVFAGMFTVLRILPIPYMAYCLWMADFSALSSFDTGLALVTVPLPWFLNLWWFTSLLAAVLRPGPKKQTKRVE